MDNTLADLNRRTEIQHKAIAAVAWAMATDSWLSADPADAMRSRGYGRYLPQLKSAVDAISVTDANVALMPFTTAFIGQVDRESLMGRLDGALRLPGNVAVRLQVGTIQAHQVAEGAVKPVGRIDFDVAGPPSKVEASIVISAEAQRSLVPWNRIL